MRKRPKIKIGGDSASKILDISLILLMIASVLIPAYYYQTLPDTIPVHFDMKGNINGYGSKNALLMIPILILVLSVEIVIIKSAKGNSSALDTIFILAFTAILVFALMIYYRKAKKRA